MYILAYICLLAGLLCAAGCAGFALIQLWQGRSDHLSLIRKAQWVTSGCLSLASAILLHALFWEDYRVEYVDSYTDAALPMFYRLTAFWAGQPGSMLFWALCAAICGNIFYFCRKPLNDDCQLWFWTFFNAVMAFFCLILTSWSNPFIMTEPVPVDGNGLNPLLQNPGMIFHPPLLFMGYAALTVPACLALAQMLTRNNADAPWQEASRSFILSGWVFLTAGIALGAWWAYMELGWGGYWGWDPVENASLLPWLAATAALHILAVENNTGKLGRSGASLMAVALVMAFFGTYLTRSGVIQSVHAFGDGGVGTPLLIFVAISLFLAIAIPLISPRRGGSLSTPCGREGALVFTAWLFMALAVIILFATTWPVTGSLLGAAPRGLDASFYNRVCLPLAVILIILLSLCTWPGWRGSLPGTKKKFLATCGAFCATVAALWVAGYHKPLPLIGAAGAMAALCAMSMHFLDRSFWKNRRVFTAVGAHLGVAIFAIGVAFSGPYALEKELLLSKGQKEAVGPYMLTLSQVSDGTGKDFDYLKATLKVEMDGKTIGEVTPERRMYAKFGDMQFSEVSIISTIGEDVYASLLGMDEDYRVLVRISLEPMINMLWIGAWIMCILPLFGLGAAGSASGQFGDRSNE